MSDQAKLDQALEMFRPYGTQHLELVAATFPSWARKWAIENDVPYVVDDDAPPGRLFLAHQGLGQSEVFST